MDKVEQAKDFLEKFGMPKAQQSSLCAYTLLVLANIGPNDNWNNATNYWMRIHNIIVQKETGCIS